MARPGAYALPGSSRQWIVDVDPDERAAQAPQMGGIVCDPGISEVSEGIVDVLYWVGLLALLAGAFFAVAVVIPRLKTDGALKASKRNYIYFGHVRHWEASELAVALESRDILPVITSQIVVMGDIAWQNRRWVQVSVWCGALGSLCLGLCGLLISFV